MTAWTVISNALVAVGAKPFASTMQALRDNPAALGECDPTAPVNQATWHPFDMVVGNDGALGRFYNGAVVASVTTPTLVAGYDYLFRGTNLSHNSGAAAAFRINGVNLFGGATYTNVDTLQFTFEIINPAGTSNHARAALNGIRSSGASLVAFSGVEAFGLGQSTITSFAFSWSAGSFDAGQLFAYRRRNYMP